MPANDPPRLALPAAAQPPTRPCHPPPSPALGPRQARRASPLACLGWCGLIGLLLTAGVAQAQEFYDHVVIVLDASGSMKERMPGTTSSKMDAAKSALRAVLQKVPPTTRVGLLVFSAANVQNDWVYPLGARDDEALIRAINPIQPGMNTPLGAYIKRGADRLLQERAKQFGYGTYRLLIVTDGEAQDRDLVDRYTPEVMARGITMDVIGVAMSQAHTLATKAHSYRRANDPEALSRAIREVFAEIAGTAQDVAQAEAFEMLAPIPTEVASAMISALSTSGNEAIGTRPAPVPRARSAPQPAPAAATVQPPPVKTPPAQPPQVRPPRVLPVPASPAPHASGGTLLGFRLMKLVLLAGVAVFFLFFVGVALLIVVLVRKGRKGARR
jgi:hypothetical protein